jgi:hypothetical protein
VFPKKLNTIRARIHEECGLDVSKQTMKRVLKSFHYSWKRIRKRVKGRPDPAVYHERKPSLQMFIKEDQAGIIDLRYFDEFGCCFVPYVPYAWQESEETIAIDSTQSTRLNVVGFMNKRND